MRPRTEPDTAREPDAPVRAILSGLFFLAGLTVGGGAVGLTVGVPMDKVLRPHAHGFPGLLGLLLGTPTGALLGLSAGLWWLRRMSHRQRFRAGGLALGVAALCALGVSGAVLLGLMRW